MSKGSRLSRLFPKLFREKDKKVAALPGQDKDTNEKEPFCIVLYLDDTEKRFTYKINWKGDTLFGKIANDLDLLETEYFGLRFVDTSGQTHWLDHDKALLSQVKGCSSPYKFYFCVKFYAADPCKLREELTRYQFFLQVKRDIVQGRLPVTFDEASELSAYVLQSLIGDYDPVEHTGGYVSEFTFVPNQTEELEHRIAAMHRRCLGASPPMAEQRFLEKTKWLEMYGVDLHPVQGESNIEYFLGLTPTGIVVYKQKTKVASYFWPRVTKVSRKKSKIFMIKVKDKNNDEHVYAFELSSKSGCKHLWKCCVEHHAFFRSISDHDETSFENVQEVTSYLSDDLLFKPKEKAEPKPNATSNATSPQEDVVSISSDFNQSYFRPLGLGTNNANLFMLASERFGFTSPLVLNKMKQGMMSREDTDKEEAKPAAAEGEEGSDSDLD